MILTLVGQPYSRTPGGIFLVRTPREVHKTRLLLHTGSSLFSAPQKSRAAPLKSMAEIGQKAGESSQKLVLTKILGFPIDFPYTKAQHCEADCRSEAKGAREGGGVRIAHTPTECIRNDGIKRHRGHRWTRCSKIKRDG